MTRPVRQGRLRLALEEVLDMHVSASNTPFSMASGSFYSPVHPCRSTLYRRGAAGWAGRVGRPIRCPLRHCPAAARRAASAACGRWLELTDSSGAPCLRRLSPSKPTPYTTHLHHPPPCAPQVDPPAASSEPAGSAGHAVHAGGITSGDDAMSDDGCMSTLSGGSCSSLRCSVRRRAG